MHRGDYRGSASHVPLHVLHACSRLQGNASGIKGDALSDKTKVVFRVIRISLVSQDDELRGFIGALRHPHECAHPHFAHVGVVEGLESQAVFLGHRAGHLGHGCRRHRVCRFVDHVSGDHRGLGNRLTLQHTAANGISPLFIKFGDGKFFEFTVGIVAVRVIPVKLVEAEHRPLGDGLPRLLGRQPANPRAVSDGNGLADATSPEEAQRLRRNPANNLVVESLLRA